MTRVNQKRFDMVRGALPEVLRRKKVAGWVIEMLIGHCTFLSLCKRGLLSVWHATYRFIRAHYATP